MPLRPILSFLRVALQEKARNFNARDQGSDERVSDYASSLKLFTSAYTGEALSSTVLLQRFVTGLRPEISRQILLQKKPNDFAAALADAIDVEYSPQFHGNTESALVVGRTQREPEMLDTIVL